MKLKSEFQIKDSSFARIEFEWDYKADFLGKPKTSFADSDSQKLLLLRKDEIWKSTCFEVFFRQKSSDRYVEVNISQQAIGIFYEFDSYRNPNPPQASSAIMRRISFSPAGISAVIGMTFEKKQSMIVR